MRFGVAVRDITPPFPTPMFGYGNRKDYYDAVNDRLTFTALVLEEGDRRALIGAADLCSFPSDSRTSELMNRLAEIVGCPRDNIMLNASHTHGGPQLPGRSLLDKACYVPEVCEQYEELLFEHAADAATEAVRCLAEGSIWYGEGKTSVPMNRRLDRQGKVCNAPNPNGHVDNRLAILSLRDAQGQLAAVGVRVSCHPVATGGQHLITADFPGAWRAEFSRAFGNEVVPFFLQGSGGDARPSHVADGDRWRTMRHSELSEIGSALLAESLAVLTHAKHRRLGKLLLQGKIHPVVWPCEKRYTRREDFEPLLPSEYAKECLRRLDAGESIPDQATFHVQTLWLDEKLALIGIGAEPLCGLARAVESAVAPKQALVLGYTNGGGLAYLPDTKEMGRGGDETQSYLSQPWTGPLEPGIEHRLAEAVMLG